MRIILTAILFFSFTAVKSQTISPFGYAVYPQIAVPLNHIPANESLASPKWFFSSYRSISTGISFFKGRSAVFIAAPMGVQLNRRLNNNFYAFANISIAPTFTNFNPFMLSPVNNKTFTNNPFRQNSFDIYPSASLGVMYINDAKTFSISGSISVERSSYPLMPYYPSVDNKRQSPVVQPYR